MNFHTILTNAFVQASVKQLLHNLEKYTNIAMQLSIREQGISSNSSISMRILAFIIRMRSSGWSADYCDNARVFEAHDDYVVSYLGRQFEVISSAWLYCLRQKSRVTANLVIVKPV